MVYSIRNIEVIIFNKAISHYDASTIFIIHNNISVIYFVISSHLIIVVRGEGSVVTTVIIFIFYIKIQSCFSASFLAQSRACPLTHIWYFLVEK
jgi:hypothetical protein